jgi:hypothetical protein
MAETLKVLGQAAPSLGVLADLYEVPAATSATASSLTVCNRGGAATTFRVTVAVGSAADEEKQALYYDLSIPANDTFIATVGLTLGAGDVVRCWSANGALTFQLFGVEVS